MSKEERGIEHVQRLGARSADGRERWTELLGLRALTKLSSIASDGAAALRSSTAFGWNGGLDPIGLRLG